MKRNLSKLPNTIEYSFSLAQASFKHVDSLYCQILQVWGRYICKERVDGAIGFFEKFIRDEQMFLHRPCNKINFAPFLEVASKPTFFEQSRMNQQRARLKSRLKWLHVLAHPVHKKFLYIPSIPSRKRFSDADTPRILSPSL